MKWPDKLNLCEKCEKVPLRPYLQYAILKGEYLDIPYPDIRPDVVTCAQEDLCQHCAKKAVECIDRINGWKDESDA